MTPSRITFPSRSRNPGIGSVDLVNFLLIIELMNAIMHFLTQIHVDKSFDNNYEFTRNNIYGTHSF